MEVYVNPVPRKQTASYRDAIKAFEEFLRANGTVDGWRDMFEGNQQRVFLARKNFANSDFTQNLFLLFYVLDRKHDIDNCPYFTRLCPEHVLSVELRRGRDWSEVIRILEDV